MRDLTLDLIPELAALEGGPVYLGSPYSKYPFGQEAAFRGVCLIAGELIKRNVQIFCPIAHCHMIAKLAQIDLLDHKIWMYQDEAFEPNAVALVIAKMRTWDTSYGLGEEQKNFERDGKPVWGLDPRILGIVGA